MEFTYSQDKTLCKAIEKYGQLQKAIAIEEMSELQKELVKDFRGCADLDHIAEEMADVYIMLRQLELMYDNNIEVMWYIATKIHRLEDRLKCETREAK